MPKIAQSLNGKWDFAEYPLSARRMEDLQAIEWLAANVPSSIFDCLIKADKIKKSDLNQTPQNFDYVSQTPWIFKKTFDANPDLLNCDRIDLVFDGLDTIATVWLNEKLIAKTDNMFIGHRLDITKYLKQKDNTLLVKFDPAEAYAKKLMSRYTTFTESDFAAPHRVYIRKAQYQFGNDFCPPLPGCGIWKQVYIEGIEKAALADLHIRTIGIGPRYADIKITISLDVITKQPLICKLTLNHDNQTIVHNLKFAPSEDSHSTVIRIANPKLWYPAGYGSHHLYQINAELSTDEKLIDSAEKSFGIRTIKLNLTDDKQTTDFQFEVNDLPIKIKGANYIPLSMFPGSDQQSDCENLLISAAEANFNMIRIWAGGYYGSDKFYELCDRLGLLVWQDFMFTCAYYPDRPWFTEMIELEATQMIKRLRNHPSLAIWCGNDKIDYMHNEGKLGKNKKFFAKNIYHKLLPNLLGHLAPDTAYIPTTPLYAKSRARTKKPLIAHKTDVWTEHRSTKNYLCPAEQIPPFVAEFGLQSLPQLQTIKTLCPKDQLRVGSICLESHNYQLDGNSRLFRYIGDLFGSAENLERFIYLSQITQARAAKKFVEHLRSHRKENNGVLLGQLNDCAPALSWSAIDYLKKPKALYYYAKRFFASQITTVIPQFEEKRADLLSKLISVHAVAINDTPDSLTANLNCRLLDLSGCMIDQIVLPITIAPFGASTPIKLPKNFICPDQPQKTCLHLMIEKDRTNIAENIFLYMPDKYIDWPKTDICTKISRINDTQWSIALTSNVIAKDVQIIAAGQAEFSDNFVDLIPSDRKTVIMTSPEPIRSDEPAVYLQFVRQNLAE